MISVTLLLALPGQAEDVTLFKNYFVTGDFATVGKGVRGTGRFDPMTGRSLATTTLTIPTCPINQLRPDCVPGENGHYTADILWAFLYWESLEKTDLPSSAVGYVTNYLGPDEDPDRSPQCIEERCTIVGKPRGAPHAAACWSNGGSTGASHGAPTLRVYRADVLRFLARDGTTNKQIPSLQVWLSDSGKHGNNAPLTEGVSLIVGYRHPALPYKGIVILDGAATLNNRVDSLTFTFNQFYQASHIPTGSKVSFFAVGNGQPNFPETLSFGTNPNHLTQLTAFGENPFIGSAGPAGYDPAGGHYWDNLTYDVSKLVSSGATSVTAKLGHDKGSFDCVSVGGVAVSIPVADKDGDGLLDTWEENGFKNLSTGDVVVPLHLMGANPNLPDLFVEIDHMVDGEHSEKPGRAALDLAGDAFLRAGIRAHFDIGGCPAGDSGCSSDPYIIKNGQVEGGDVIDERAPSFYCTSYSPECLFPGQPGLIFWKQGLAHIMQLSVPGKHKVYFNPNRGFLFHYVVFGHALAMKALDKDGNPIPGPLGGFLATSASGRGDLKGKHGSVTFGRWANRTDIGVAGTLVHELGHNFGLYHGGTATGANCNVVYVGSMNYLYQIAGTLLANGTAVPDYSREALPPPTGTENALDEFSGLGSGPDMLHRLRWYAPRGNIAALLGVSPSTFKLPERHCNGSIIPTGGNPSELVRVDGFGVARRPIDWNYNTSNINTPQQDLDFDGSHESVFAGMNDIALITANQGLRQLNSARSLFGLSLGVGFADLAHEGEIELGEIELGEIELGEVELGEVELGEVELGEIELGEIELGESELGTQEEIDETIAADIGTNVPPTNLTAQVARQYEQFTVTLNWTPPAAGIADEYLLYRADGPEVVAPLTRFTLPDTVTTFVDRRVEANKTYTYFVIANFGGDRGLSGPSNTVTVTTRLSSER
jgi:hypothetical protein